MLYGDDDPLQWPQPFVADVPHLPLIRLPPKSRSDPLCAMWWLPKPSEFLPDDSVVSGLGKLHPQCIAILSAPCRQPLQRAKLPRYKSYVLLREHATHLTTLLNRLSHLSMTFDRACLAVREAQRSFLELLACLDWFDVFKPRSTAGEPYTGKVERVVGCFTNNLGVAESLYRSGVPVYLIRNCDDYLTIRVKEVVQLIRPEHSLLSVSTSRASYAQIYKGPSNSIQKYSALYRWSHLFHASANPFNKHRMPSPPKPVVSIASVNRQARAQRYSPYAQRTKTKRELDGPQGRNKFTDPLDPIFPPPIPAWRDALCGVNQSESNFVDQDVLPSDFGYAFPEPASFTAFEKIERRNSVFCSWLRYRHSLIHRLSFEASDARPMSGKAWRDLLSLDYLEHSKSSKKTKNSSRLDLLSDFLQSCLEGTGSRINDIIGGQEMWCGKSFDQLKAEDFEEILWELSELNFRQDLLA
ncbi:hypothetical protein H0H93_002605, partial [Arthromyces matolae]